MQNTLSANRADNPSRYWWLALLVILLVAAAFRLTGYNFSLPYVDHPDEPNHAIAGRMMVDMGTAKAIGLQGYPPGLPILNYVLIRFFHDPTTPPTTLIWVVRLISIASTLGTVVLIGLLGRLVSSPLGGLLAAAFYAVTTIFVEFGRYGMADNFVAFFSMLAIWMALVGTLNRAYGWTRWSNVAMMMAIIFKYQAGALLPLVFALPLVNLPSLNGPERKALIRHLLGSAGYLAAFLFWLLAIYPALEASLAPNWAARSSSMTRLPSNILENAVNLINDLALNILIIPVLAGLVLVWFWRDASLFRRRLSFAVVFLAIALWHGAVSMYDEQQFRQFVGEASFIAILVGAGVAAWAWPLQRLAARLVLKPRTAALVSSATVSALTIFALIPQFNSSVANAYEHTLPDRRNDLATYVDISLPPGPYIAERDNDKTLNGAWGGYAGLNIFRHIARGNVDDASLDEWRERGAIYAIEDYVHYQMYADTEQGRDILEETLLLKSYPPDPAYRGPSMVVLRLTPIQHETDEQLGPITLRGYDLDNETVAPGEDITFTLYWQTERALDSEYAVYNHLTPLDERTVIAQVDNVPLFDVRRPTQTWDDPDETFISRPYTMTIPADTPPGTYRLITGFYRRSDGVRLLSPEGEDFALVTTLEVE
jgi:hypothetical protein